MANLNVLKDKIGNILNPHIPRYDVLKYDLKENVEIKTGEKRDGKDVYKKLIKVTSLPNATIQQYNHNIANVDKIWLDSSNSFIKFADGSMSSLPYIGGGGDNSTSVEITSMTSTSFSINTH